MKKTEILKFLEVRKQYLIFKKKYENLSKQLKNYLLSKEDKKIEINNITIGLQEVKKPVIDLELLLKFVNIRDILKNISFSFTLLKKILPQNLINKIIKYYNLDYKLQIK